MSKAQVINTIINKYGILIEEFFSKQMSKKHSQWANHIEDALNNVEKIDGGYRGWALSKSAIRSFCVNLLNYNSAPYVIELGGGQSTLFWEELINNSNLDLKVITLEHNLKWIDQLKQKISLEKIEIHYEPLYQIDNEGKQLMFSNPAEANKVWKSKAVSVPDCEIENTRIHNAFYELDHDYIQDDYSLDGMIVDGPHGDGRSLAFPLFYKYLKPDAWILIDDFDHYTFLEDLSYIYTFDIKMKYTQFGKRWVLLQLKGTL